MQLKCGPTWAEKRQRLLVWHPYFAWWPVRVGPTDCRWLETVERKVGWIGRIYGGLFDIQYRAMR